MLELAASFTPKRVSVDREARIESGLDPSQPKELIARPSTKSLLPRSRIDLGLICGETTFSKIHNLS